MRDTTHHFMLQKFNRSSNQDEQLLEATSIEKNYFTSININLLLFYEAIGVIKDVQDEMLKGETSGQIFAVVHIGKCVKVSTFLKKSFFQFCIRQKCMLMV